MSGMNDAQLLRFNRQIMVPGFDISGQEKLLAAKVLIVGLGGLGCPAALYLAAAGVGQLVLADGDVVDVTNLQRQVLHNESTVGQSKVDSARQQLLAINSACKVHTLEKNLEGEALQQEVSAADLVLDCTDNFASRFAINKACVESSTPLVSAAAIRAEGQLLVIDPRSENAACYQCLYKPGDSEAPTCSENGVLAPLVGVLGSMQALEALKILSGFGQPAVGKLLVLDAKIMQWREFALKRDAHCDICSA